MKIINHEIFLLNDESIDEKEEEMKE